MKYTISAIKRKAERLGDEYLEDCRALSEVWDEDRGEAVFSEAAVREIKDTWSPQPTNRKPCTGCRGL